MTPMMQNHRVQWMFFIRDCSSLDDLEIIDAIITHIEPHPDIDSYNALKALHDIVFNPHYVWHKEPTEITTRRPGVKPHPDFGLRVPIEFVALCENSNCQSPQHPRGKLQSPQHPRGRLQPFTVPLLADQAPPSSIHYRFIISCLHDPTVLDKKCFSTLADAYAFLSKVRCLTVFS